MDRPDQLREEAACLERAAAFLFAEAMRKRAIAREMDRIGGTEAVRGGDRSPPPRLDDQCRGHGT